MDAFALGVNPNKRYQIFTLGVEPDGFAIRARVELRYLNETKHWYLSIFNAASGEAICRYVPVIASYGQLIDLMGPFHYKHIGSIYCIPVTRQPSSLNPGLDNLAEFELVWGDTDDS